MAEKTPVTIDCELVIATDQEKVFENQYIRLEAGIRCLGKLTFINCTIEPCANLESKSGRKPICRPGCISMDMYGKLEMIGCEIVHPGQEFLSGWDMTVKDTSFLIPSCADSAVTALSVSPCFISANGKTIFEDCTFVEELSSVPSSPVLNLVSYNSARMKKCTFKNITGKIEAIEITDCSFTGCANIESEIISGSTFTDCGSISVNSETGYIRNCDFVHVQFVYSAFADITDCRFQKLENSSKDEGMINVEDSTVAHCSFDDVELRNGSYLIEGVGNASIEFCKFTNCRTDRENMAICCGKVLTGKIQKRWIEVDILDENSCTGQDEVENLN